jgi:phage terminase small subunit
MEEIHNENTADIQEIVEYLTSVMRAKSESYVMIMSGNGTQKVVQKPPDEKERLKAAELLGKRFGMFTDNVDVTSNGQTVIVDDIDG